MKTPVETSRNEREKSRVRHSTTGEKGCNAFGSLQADLCQPSDDRLPGTAARAAPPWVCLAFPKSVSSIHPLPLGFPVSSWRRSGLVMAASLVFTQTTAFAQKTSLGGNVVAAVGGRSVAAAEVLISSLRLTTRSDSAGRYQLDQIPLGTHDVTVRAIGYQALTVKLDFLEGREVRATFQLTATTATLDTVNVKSTVEARWVQRLAEFEQRRQSGVGAFVSRDQLEKKASMTVPGILATLVRGIRTARIGGYDVAVSTRGGRNCAVQVLLNRMVMYNGERLYFDINSISADEILAIEYHTPYTTPSDLNGKPRGNFGGSRCGTLMFWMK